jgi:hypothetical protein
VKSCHVICDESRWKSCCAALLCSLAAMASAAELPGRLFFTPEQRALLDRQRARNIPASRQETSGTLHLDGIVRRKGGTTTIWVNGHVQRDDDDNPAMRIAASSREPDRVALRIGNAPSTMSLRVGETLHRAAMQTTDVLAHGQVQSANQHSSR